MDELVAEFKEIKDEFLIIKMQEEKMKEHLSKIKENLAI